MSAPNHNDTLPILSRGGGLMSRFHPFEAYGWRLELRPVGWRKLPLLRRIPNLTGDTLVFRVASSQVGQSTKEDEARVVAFHMCSVRDLSEISASQQEVLSKLRKEQLSFGRVSFSGEYRIDAIYAQQKEDGRWVQHRDLGVGAIQVRVDYWIFTPIFGVITAVLGVGGTLLVQWLT